MTNKDIQHLKAQLAAQQGHNKKVRLTRIGVNLVTACKKAVHTGIREDGLLDRAVTRQQELPGNLQVGIKAFKHVPLS
jgi:hypothetical protein